MKEEKFENKFNNSDNNIKNEKNFICIFCNKQIPPDIFEDHILCHKINEEEKDEINNIDDNKINDNNSEKNNSEETSNSFGSKFLGIFENIGNKAKELFKNENKEEKKYESDSKTEQPSKISMFFNNLADKISEKFEEITQEISDKLDKKYSKKEDTPINLYNLPRNDEHNDNRDNDNIDDLLFRFEQEDDNFNNIKNNLFKESDANEILRYIPNSIIQKEKNKNDDNYQCMICLYEFKIGDKVCTLPCLHIFHFDCLKNWIIRNRLCPICKYDCSLESLLTNNIVDNI